MSFRIIPAKRVKKKKSVNGKEVLKRLEDYLQSDECQEPVEILCGFWKDQQDAITYQEIRKAVADGEISEETLELWRQDYSVLVTTKMHPAWKKAMAAGSAGQPVLDGTTFEFNTMTPGAFNWIDKRGASFVTVCTQEQKSAIAALLEKKMVEGHTVDELARLIRPCIGLTEKDARANARYYDNIVATLKKEHPRMKPENIRRKALDASQKYAEKQHRARAFTIAQTESAFAYNQGADEGIRQAQSKGWLGTMKKRWSTSGDDGVCSTCNALEGTEVDMDADFEFKGKPLFPGQHMLPPAHPLCACAIEYIEVEKNNHKLGAEASEDDMESTDLTYLGDIDPEKRQEAIEYDSEEIRTREAENVVIIDKNGKTYYAVGKEDSVSFSIDGMERVIITHNHPASNGILSFGEDDFTFLKYNNNIEQLIAVNEEYTYKISLLKDISEVSYNDVYLAGFKYAAEPDFEAQDAAMRVLKERGYVNYERIKVKP